MHEVFGEFAPLLMSAAAGALPSRLRLPVGYGDGIASEFLAPRPGNATSG